MSFIGVFTQGNNEGYLKQSLEKKLAPHKIFFLKENSISNLKNIKFETILIGKKVTKQKEEIKELIKKAKYLAINTDIPENLELLQDLNLTVITYGFNSKSTITTSSVEASKIIVYLQRGIESVQGNIVEPQEIKIHLSNEESSYAVMEMVSLRLLYS